MSKHTPGPWSAVLSDSAVPYGNWSVLDAEGYPVGTHSGEFDCADARLIAAAPRMSEALKRAANLLAKIDQSNTPAILYAPAILSLRVEIVACIKEATPEYYGIATGERT